MTQDLYKQKKSLELSWEQEYNESGRYTLDMVRIDDKIREIITEIKQKIQHGIALLKVKSIHHLLTN